MCVGDEHQSQESAGRRALKMQKTLRTMYIITSALSAMMVFWILIMPSSWLIGKSKLHDNILFSSIDPHGVAPPHTLNKYAGHTTVHLTHILPGAIWAGLIPLQLHSTLRRARPRLHRLSGYVFIIVAVLMAVGIFIILKRDLLFENFFDVEDPESEISSKPMLIGLAFYFTLSVLLALKYAKDRAFAAHQRWIIRHIASGLWIAIQRVLLLTVYQFLHRPPVSPDNQKHSFARAGVIGVALSLILGEYAIYLVESLKRQKRA